MTYSELWQRLTPIYEEGEAKAIVSILLDVRFGLSTADIYSGKINELSADNHTLLEKMMRRLEKAEPIQYVLGETTFVKRTFHVAQGVLIPRPETEELVRLIIQHSTTINTPPRGKKREALTTSNILDIGTGSGCIAISLALEMPETHVTAWDISKEALQIAQLNAERLKANVHFEKKDILNLQPSTFNLPPQWDTIVSNPPYICEQEASQMEKNVLAYEPRQALFVPDENPLLFYRAIAHYAKQALKPSGELYFEVNPLYTKELTAMLQASGFKETEVRTDQFGKERFIKSHR